MYDELELIDHVVESKSNVLEQFKDARSVYGIIKAFSLSLNSIESQINKLNSWWWLDRVEGIYLDIIGKIVGETRRGRNDSDYKVGIQVRIGINRSYGQPEIAIALVKALTGANYVQYQPVYPANITFFTDGPIIVTDLSEQLLSVTPLGVGAAVIYSTGGGTPFVFDGDTQGLGFDAIINAGTFEQSGDGGILSGVISYGEA